MIRFRVESRDPASPYPIARTWSVEPVGSSPIGFRTRAEAASAIEELRRLGHGWARAEYRVEPVSL